MAALKKGPNEVISGLLSGLPGPSPAAKRAEPEAGAARCDTCNDTGWFLVEENGLERMRPCVCKEQRRRERLLEQARVPRRYQHCSLDGFELWNANDPTLASAVRKVRDFVDAFPEATQGLLLMGGVGTGKTHLAIAALKEIVMRYGVRGRFSDLPTLIQEIQMTFDGPGSSRELLAPLISADVLLLDELGSGRPSQWTLDLLYYLVNTRYLEQRLTLFTTNFTDFPRNGEESFADRISARVRSRLYEMCDRVELRGADYREQRSRAQAKQSRDHQRSL